MHIFHKNNTLFIFLILYNISLNHLNFGTPSALMHLVLVKNVNQIENIQLLNESTNFSWQIGLAGQKNRSVANVFGIQV